MKPMLARTVGPKYCHFPAYGQPKLNGVRALQQRGVHGVDCFQSRDEKVWRPAVLKHLSDELRSIHHIIGTRILDGELYKHGWRLEDINGAVAVNRKEPREDTHEIEFHVFDIVDPLRSFSERWLDLYVDCNPELNLPHIKFVRTELIHSYHMFQQFFHHWTSQGYEGIMLRPDGPYEFGEHYSERSQGMTQYRSQYLWKHKHWEDGEFRCVGVTQGEGKADIGIGALICETNIDEIPDDCDDPEDFINEFIPETFKVGSGLNDKDRRRFMDDPPINKSIKIRYLNLTSNGIPFNPSFLAVIQ